MSKYLGFSTFCKMLGEEKSSFFALVAQHIIFIKCLNVGDVDNDGDDDDHHHQMDYNFFLLK